MRAVALSGYRTGKLQELGAEELGSCGVEGPWVWELWV